MAEGGLVGKALTKLQETTGQTVVPAERLEVLEAYYEDYRILSRQLENIGWNVLNYIGGQGNEMSPAHRLKVVKQAEYVWMNDPQAGASVELMNDFVFGRGIPRPRAKDEEVQAVIDEAWDDPDNQEILTTIDAQLALGTDLSLQSNIFVLVFGLDDETADSIVKLSILRHDDVFGYVPHPEKRHRVLYYLAREVVQEWDYTTDTLKPLDPSMVNQRPTYYAHWRNVDLTEEEDDTPAASEWKAPDERVGDGRVYHLRINRRSEQVFGNPRFQRTLTWYSAYNKYVKDRLDIVAAAASLIMKRKIKGTPSQLMRDATRAISQDSPLGAAGFEAQVGPRRPAGIVEENESVEHQAFNLDTKAANAQVDGALIRSPISAAERFPASYYGDASSSNLATATSLELPVLKAVEARQEVFERMVRFFVDRVIEKAVDSGKISISLDPGETEDEEPVATPVDKDPNEEVRQALMEAVRSEQSAGREVVEVARVTPRPVNGVAPELRHSQVLLLVSVDEGGAYHYSLLEGYEDQGQDEAVTERDLSYEFSMPSPLRRMMADLISSITSIAQTFDPNNTNPKLSRILLTIALGEGLEVQDAPDLVDEAIPKGYMDPMIKAQLESVSQPQPQPGPGAGDGSDQIPSGPDGNAYSSPMNSTRPEDMRSGAYAAQESEVVGRTRARDGSVVIWTRRRQLEEGIDEVSEPVRRQVEGDRDDATETFARDVIDVALDGVDRERFAPRNGSKPSRG